jgi:hypothetical protein
VTNRPAVRARRAATVSSALLWTPAQGSGATFTPAVRAAWTDVYDLLATTMQAAANKAAPATTRSRRR